jgi:hypothetical protein
MKLLYSTFLISITLPALSSNLQAASYFYDLTFDAYQSYPQATIRYLSTNAASPSNLSYVSGSVNGCSGVPVFAYLHTSTQWAFQTTENCGSAINTVVEFVFYVNSPLNVGTFEAAAASRGVETGPGFVQFFDAGGTLVIAQNTSPGPQSVPEPGTAGLVGLTAIMFVGASVRWPRKKGMLMNRVATVLLIGVVASAIANATVIYTFEGTPANQTVQISFVLSTSDYLSLTAANNYQISIPCNQFSQETNCSGSVIFTNGMANSNFGNQDVIVANGANFLFDPEAFVVSALHYSQNHGDPTENNGQLNVQKSPGPTSVPEPGYSICIAAVAVLAIGFTRSRKKILSRLPNNCLSE